MNAGGSYDTVDFTVSPYSLPYSDNTLLRSGNRFGVYIRRVERPTNFVDVREALKLDPQDSRQ